MICINFIEGYFFLFTKILPPHTEQNSTTLSSGTAEGPSIIITIIVLLKANFGINRTYGRCKAKLRGRRQLAVATCTHYVERWNWMKSTKSSTVHSPHHITPFNGSARPVLLNLKMPICSCVTCWSVAIKNHDIRSIAINAVQKAVTKNGDNYIKLKCWSMLYITSLRCITHTQIEFKQFTTSLLIP